jgi:TM2 domain-containing membrane protein YozV
MPDDWYFARNNERKGPVSFAKLKSMAEAGWLGPDDYVWQQGMTDWIPARDAEGLFLDPLGRVLQKTIPGLHRTAESGSAETAHSTTPPGIPEKTPHQRGRKPKAKPLEISWDELSPRHIVAACGGFLTALGIAFTAVARSNIALAFTLSGLFVAAVGLHVELGKLLGQAIENIGKASKEAAERRLRAKELALEKQRLDLEAARLAQEQAAREAPLPPALPMAPVAPVAPLANQQSDYVPQLPTGSGQVLVINHPPVQRWSPGLAAVLSFFVPGLGQLYKGQILNGIVWFFMVGLGYLALILPGLFLHFFCVLGALSGNPWTEGKTTVVRE